MEQQNIVTRTYYTEYEVAEMISAAVSAERERCAQVAGGIWDLQSVDGVRECVITDPISAEIMKVTA